MITLYPNNSCDYSKFYWHFGLKCVNVTGVNISNLVQFSRCGPNLNELEAPFVLVETKDDQQKGSKEWVKNIGRSSPLHIVQIFLLD